MIDAPRSTATSIDEAPGRDPVGAPTTRPRLARRIIAAASVTGLSSVLALVFGTLANAIVARHGGPQGYAAFVAANMLVFGSAAFSECGLSLALAKHVAHEEEQGRHDRVRRINTTTLGVMAAIALVIGLIVALNLAALEKQLLGPNILLGEGFAVAFPLILVCTLVAYGASGIYYGLLRPRANLIIWAAGPPAMVIYILLRRAGWPLPIWGAVATSYITSGLVASYQLWRDQMLGAPLPLRELRPVLQDLVPAASFTFFTVFSTWCDRWMVGAQLGALHLGLYAAAVAVIQAALRVPTNISYMIVPASTKAALGGSGQSARLNAVVVEAFGWFAALMSVLILLTAPLIVQVLFGPGFLLAVPALLYMTPSLLAAAINYPFMSALTGGTRDYRLILLLSLTIPLRLLLLWSFTRYWGVSGTALATALADCLLALYCILLARKAAITLPLHALARPCLMALVAYGAGAGALWLGAPQLVAAALALAAFVPALYAVTRQLRAQSV